MKLFSFLPKSIEPIRIVEWVIALFTFFGSFYLFTPLYQISVAKNGLTGVAILLNSTTMTMIFAAVLLVSSVIVMIGLWKKLPQLKSAGWFGILMARFFQLLSVFTLTGFLPLSWIYLANLVTLVLVLWIFARVEVSNVST